MQQKARYSLKRLLSLVMVLSTLLSFAVVPARADLDSAQWAYVTVYGGNITNVSSGTIYDATTGSGVVIGSGVESLVIDYGDGNAKNMREVIDSLTLNANVTRVDVKLDENPEDHKGADFDGDATTFYKLTAASVTGGSIWFSTSPCTYDSVNKKTVEPASSTAITFAEADDTVYVIANPNKNGEDATHTLSSVTANQTGTDTSVAVTAPSVTVDGEGNVSGSFNYSFTMPSNAVTVTPTFKSLTEEDSPSVQITVNTEGVTNGTVTYEVRQATPEKVTITLTAVPNDGYVMSTQLTVTKTVGEEAPAAVTGNFTYDDQKKAYERVIEENSPQDGTTYVYTVSGAFVQKSYSITKGSSLGDGFTVKAGDNVVAAAVAGTQITVTGNVPAGKMIVGKKDETVLVMGSSFTMPASDITLDLISVLPGDGFKALPSSPTGEISSGRYYLTGGVTFSGAGTQLQIKQGATVYIYLNGYTFTATGQAGLSAGAKAGVLLPVGSTLNFVGPGTVEATGGDGTNGGAAGHASSGSVTAKAFKASASPGTGGTGGAGGYGGAAGIGTNANGGGSGTVNLFGAIVPTLDDGDGGDGGTRGNKGTANKAKCAYVVGNSAAYAEGADGGNGGDGGGGGAAIGAGGYNGAAGAAGANGTFSESTSWTVDVPMLPWWWDRVNSGNWKSEDGKKGNDGADGSSVYNEWTLAGISADVSVKAGNLAKTFESNTDLTNSETVSTSNAPVSVSNYLTGTGYYHKGGDAALATYDASSPNWAALTVLTDEIPATATDYYRASKNIKNLSTNSTTALAQGDNLIQVSFQNTTSGTTPTHYATLNVFTSDATSQKNYNDLTAGDAAMFNELGDAGENTVRYIYNNMAHTFSGTTGGVITTAPAAGTLWSGTQTSTSTDALMNLANSENVNYAVLYVPYNSFKEYTGGFTEATSSDTTTAIEYSGLMSNPQQNVNNWLVKYLADEALTSAALGAAKLNGTSDVAMTAAEIKAFFGEETNTKLARRDGDTLQGLANIHNAGMYVIFERVLSWQWNDTTMTNEPYYVYNRYNVIVEQAKLDITSAQDSVTQSAMVRNHAWYIFATGVNGEYVHGEFTFAADSGNASGNLISKGENWNSFGGQTVTATNGPITGIDWEFNIGESAAEWQTSTSSNMKTQTVDGKRLMNNYIDQNDGPNVTWYGATGTTTVGGLNATTTGENTNNASLKAQQNSYYSGSNGILLFAEKGKVAEMKADGNLSVKLHYEKDQAISELSGQTLNVTYTKTAKETDATDGDKSALDTSGVMKPNTTYNAYTGIFGEDFGLSATMANAAYYYGIPVRVGDAVNGTAGENAKITGQDKLPTVLMSRNDLTDAEKDALFAKLVGSDKYKGDLYYITVKDKDGNIVKSWSYNDNSNNNTTDVMATTKLSTLPLNGQAGANSTKNEVYDGLRVGDYTVTLTYVGLYYGKETPDQARADTWEGNEEFIWVTDSVSFPFTVAPRNVAVKSISDLTKVYDSTRLLVKDELTNGDVTKAVPYEIVLKNSTTDAQFEKNATIVLYNYIQPEDESDITGYGYDGSYNTQMQLELAGTYSAADADVASARAVTLSALHIEDSGTKKDVENYKLLNYTDGESASVTLSTGVSFQGDIDVAQMYLTHGKSGEVKANDFTPMRDILNVRVQAFMPENRALSYGNDGYFASTGAAFTKIELVSEDDATKTTDNRYPANMSLSTTQSASKYDYDLKFELVLDSNSNNLIYHGVKTVDGITFAAHESGLGVNDDTGAVGHVALTASNSSGVNQMPQVILTVQSFGNYVVVKQSADETDASYGKCAETNKTNNNGPRDTTKHPLKDTDVVPATTKVDTEIIKHTMRYSIVDNSNSYDVLLPLKSTLGISMESDFPNIKSEGGKPFYPVDSNAGTATYRYATIRENTDTVTFTFYAPQQQLLKDVKLFALPAQPTQDSTAAVPGLAAMQSSDSVSGATYLGNLSTLLGANTETAPFKLTIDSITPLTGDALTALPAADATAADINGYHAGAAYTFTLTTGPSSAVVAGGVGPNYNIVVVPVYGFTFDGKLLDKDALTPMISVEKAYPASATELNAITNTGAAATGVYLNYKTAYTTDNEGSVTLTYGSGSDTKTFTQALNGLAPTYFTSVKLDGTGEAATSYNNFFNKNTLTVGTPVTVTVNVWRNGMNPGNQVGGADPDAHDTATFTWTVTQDDYDRLFPDISVTAGVPDGSGVSAASVSSGNIASEGQEVSINATTAGTKSVSLDQSSLAYIADANDSDDNTKALALTDAALSITYPTVGLTFSKEAMNSVQTWYSTNGGTGTMTIAAEKVPDLPSGINDTFKADAMLTKAQAVKAADTDAIFYELTAKVNTTPVEFEGKVTVSVPFIGAANRIYSVYHLEENGSTTWIPSTLTNGALTFTTTHFSVYYITSTATSSPVVYSGGVSAPATAATAAAAAAENGKVKLSDPYAKSGTEVTVTATPAEGYEVDTVSVKDKNGNEIALTKNKDGTYSFTMPESAKLPVAVSATFAKIAETDAFDSFSDLDKDAWYRDDVLWAIENGVMNGLGDGTFAPNGTTTRAMVAQILWNLESKPAYVGMSEYTDVDNEAWYGSAIRWASAEGIVTGYDGKFAPNDPVTREQLATMLYRYAQYKNIDVSVGEDTNILSYEDAFNVNTWAMAALQWACGAGVVNGADVNGTIYLQPQNSATRAVVATMIARFCTEVAK